MYICNGGRATNLYFECNLVMWKINVNETGKGRNEVKKKKPNQNGQQV